MSDTHGSRPTAGPQQDRSPQDRSPQDRSPQDRSPQDRSPQDRSPQDRSPQDRSPQDRSPQDRSPYNPADWTPVLERAFFERLEQLVGAAVGQRVRERLTGVRARMTPLVANAVDAANARLTALAVAAYDVLLDGHGSAEAARIVDDCLNRPLREDVLAGTRDLLDGAEDPFVALVAVSRERERSSFGPSFRFERPVDDDDTYVLEVRRCLWHELLVAAGRPELQPVLCRFDLNRVDAIDPDRHRLRFVRPVTFASGRTCRFVFSREEHLPGLSSGRAARDRPGTGGPARAWASAPVPG